LAAPPLKIFIFSWYKTLLSAHNGLLISINNFSLPDLLNNRCNIYFIINSHFFLHTSTSCPLLSQTFGSKHQQLQFHTLCHPDEPPSLGSQNITYTLSFPKSKCITQDKLHVISIPYAKVRTVANKHTCEENKQKGKLKRMICCSSFR